MKSISLLASLAAVSAICLAMSCSSKSDSNNGAAGSSTGGTNSGGGSGGKGGSSTVGAGGDGTAIGTGGDGTAIGTGGDGTGATGGGSDVPVGTPGWTKVPLIDGMADPQNPEIRKDTDWVSGIYFASLDDGWVVTRQGGDDAIGGAVFKATSTAVTSILFSGSVDPLCEVIAGGGIDFTGIQKSTDGYVAMHAACNLIASHDNGKTFKIELNAQDQGEVGINEVFAMRPLEGGGTLMYEDDNIVTAPTAPGHLASWTTVWAPPPATPTTPNPFPADACQEAETHHNLWQPTVAYVSPKADFIAYTAHDADLGPIVCVSDQSATVGGIDKARKFLPYALPGVPDSEAFAAPAGVAFTSNTTGIAYYGNNIYPGEEYVYRTTDGGKTWKASTIPTAVVNNQDGVEFNSAFFAPDGLHGWIVGLNYKGGGQPFIMRTADGGVTWDASSGDLVAQAMPSGVGRLYTGFALDENHIWVGGDSGILMANAAGGI